MPRPLVLVLLLALPARGRGDDLLAAAYFPLRVGNWWAYEEQDCEGGALSRETWALVGDAAGEFHLRSLTKRLDGLGHSTGTGRWEGHEYLRATADGLRKRYPAGRHAEVDVLLVKEPARLGTSWQDAQGKCEVATDAKPCAGPRGELPRCLVVVCRLGKPTATVVTSTYAWGIGMVRQEVELIQLMPTFQGGGGLVFPTEAATSGRSILRLTAYHVDPPPPGSVGGPQRR